MRENSRFPSRWLAPLGLALLCAGLQAQVQKVESSKTITVAVPGATAAFALDSTYAEAAAENGVVSISGRMHGTTHVVVVTASGSVTLEVIVSDPPVKRPAGFLDPLMAHAGTENGYLQSQYNSSSGQLQSQLDLSRHQGDTTVHAQVTGTRQLGSLAGDQARMSLASAYYQISTPRRDITILDQYLDESPLTITGSIVRGLHFRQDGWFLHAGYTSIAAFEGLLLTARAEGVIEAGYRRPLAAHSSLTGTFYHFSVPSSDTVGRSGSVALLTYAYTPREDFRVTAEAGLSRGAAASVRLDYKNDRDAIRGSFRYAPSTFASLGANNLKGLNSDLSWTRRLTAKLSSDLTFYSNRLALPGLQQSTVTAGARLQYRFSPHWSLFGGATGSTYQTTIPPRPPVRNLSAPGGLTFGSRYFGAQGQYQFSEVSQQNSGGHQFRTSVNARAGPLSVSAFAERQTQAPTLSLVLGQARGLQQALDLLGVQATTIQQVDQFLSDYAYLFAAGYIKSAIVNLAPVRRQVGGSLNFMGRGRYPQVGYNFLYNDNQGLTGNAISVNHSVTYTQRLGAEDFSLSYSVVGMKTPGLAVIYMQMFSTAWRHQVHSVPSFIIPEHHGVISGIVFRDDSSKGTYEPGMAGVAGAKVVLDGSRRAETGADGSFRFPRVPVGKHRLVVSYQSEKPMFYSTQSEVDAAENATVNFGIGISLSSLMGTVANDAGQGVTGVTVTIRNKDKHWSATTDAAGSFFLRPCEAGEYQVEIDPDSVPPGYLTSELTAQSVNVDASTPGNAVFSVRALRSIGGQVLTFDKVAGKYVPVAARLVSLKETSKTRKTDASGRYIFRDLPAGTYTVSAMGDSRETTKTVKLPPAPSTLTNIDLQLNDWPVQPAAKPAPVPNRKP